MSRPLPTDTLTAVTERRRIADCKNLGLLLDKFAPWELAEDRWDLTMRVRERRQRQEQEILKRGSAAKGIWLREQPRGNEVDPILRPNTHIDRRLLEHACARWEDLVRAQGATPFVMAVDYRLVVGFGAEHVLETNLCLHRIYGFPIIPGSAVKGVTRSWALLEENLPEEDELLRRVFGTTDEQGQVIFFDAYPTQAPKLELDILNPHYGDYYQKKSPPADYLKPNPNYFLTVAKDSPFQFAVASKNLDLAVQAKKWLTYSLTDLGIGGKTAAGYGFMEIT